MKVYGLDKSRSFRIIWMFNELGVDYEYVRLATKEDLFSDWFLKLNPAGKIPVLVDDKLVLTESAAIITYLGDKYPEKELVPVCDSIQRAYYNQWSFFALTELEQPLWTIAKHQFVFPEKMRVSAVNKSALWEFRQILSILEKGLLGKEWILGDKFSAADILIGHTLHWAINNKIKLKNKTLENYHSRLTERNAFMATLKG